MSETNYVDELLIKIGLALRKERLKCQLPITKYAEYIGVPVKIIHKIEEGGK